MPFIRLFEVPLIYHTLICVRDLSVSRYGLEYGDLRCWMTVTTAYSFGYAGTRLRNRRLSAKMKPGHVFRNFLTAVDGKTKVPWEIGVVDSGDAIYFAFDNYHAEIGMREEQLLQALRWLLDDVSSINEASDPRPYQGNVVPGLRGPGLELPDFAIDELWTEDGRRK